MRKVYVKDECAPDAMSSIEWFLVIHGFNNAEQLRNCKIGEKSEEFNDESYVFYCVDNKIYAFYYSCGVYQEVFLVEPQDFCKIANSLFKETP